MPAREPDVPALRASLRADFADHWDHLVAYLDENYDRDDEPQESHYAWFGALVHAVLGPAIEGSDAALCVRVLDFSLPLHGTPLGNAVQHRGLRYACRDDVATRLLPLLRAEQAARLLRLCEAREDGR